MRDNLEIEFIGADHEVTGSCHYICAAGHHLLVDYGMEQGVNYFKNVGLPVEAREIEYVFVTHAHIDHTGLLPKLHKDGFRGRVITTEATAQLCEIMLKDAADIQESDAAWKNKHGYRTKDGLPIEPLFTMEDTKRLLRRFEGFPYDQKLQLCEGIEFRFTDVGHLLGSASIELWLTEENQTKKIVFSGDIGNINQPLLRDPIPTKQADYVLIESTYGDRLHSPGKGEIHTEDYVKELAEIIGRTFARGGNVLIPSFAVGRTQEMLYFLRLIKEKGLIKNRPHFPVYVDSPLAVEATGVFTTNERSCFDEEAMQMVKKGINPLDFEDLYPLVTTEESKTINYDKTPKVILAASGMCDAGRIRHHLKYNLWRPESTILFVGYQSKGTLGRQIIESAKAVKVLGETIEVKAEIAQMTGLSGHADKEGLLRWFDAFDPKPCQTFVVHGEDKTADRFAACLQEKYGIRADAPYSGTRYDLLQERFTEVKQGVPVADRRNR